MQRQRWWQVSLAFPEETLQYLWYLALARWGGLIIMALVLVLGYRWGMTPFLFRRSLGAWTFAAVMNAIGTPLYRLAHRRERWRPWALRWGYWQTVVDLLALLYGLHVFTVGNLRLVALLLVVFFGAVAMVFPPRWTLFLLVLASGAYVLMEVGYLSGRLPVWSFAGQPVERSLQEAVVEGLVVLAITLINTGLLYAINERLRQSRGQAQARERRQRLLQRLVAHGLRSENLEQLRQTLLDDLAQVTQAEGVALYVLHGEGRQFLWSSGRLQAFEQELRALITPVSSTPVPERTEALPVVLGLQPGFDGWLQPLRLPFTFLGQGYEGWLWLWYAQWPPAEATEASGLRQVADTVTLLLARVMALEDLQHQVTLLRFLTRAIHRLSQTLERQTLSRLVVELACQLLGAPRGALYLFLLTPEHRRLHCAYALNLPDTYIQFVEEHYAELPGFRLISAAEGPVLHFPDIPTEGPELLRRIAEHAPFPLQALTLVRIASSEHLLGALALYWGTPRRLSPGEQDALYLLAAQAGVMLHNAQLYTYLQDEAHTDPLTGLYNRRALLRLWYQVLEQMRGQQRPLSVLLIDLDRFKAINDRYGHQVGDLVLRQVAGFLRQWFPAQFPVVRYGGDEFLVLLVGVDAEQVRAMALKLQLDFRHFRPDVPKHLEPQIGVSVGWAIYPEDGETLQELIQTADARMYRQKAAQRQEFPSPSQEEPDVSASPPATEP